MPANSTDSYWTIAQLAKAESPKTKGSRFIGEAFPVDSAERALELLGKVRKREHSATHHCWAYRVAADGSTFRYSDDGEPNGSAGLPIYREIEGRGLSNVLVVVTRYYGGTKLGTGGLVRAYSEAAGLVLDQARRREVILRASVRLRFGFDDTSPAMHTIGRFDAEIADTSYSEDGTEMLVNVRISDVKRLEAAFVEALGGRGSIVVTAPET